MRHHHTARALAAATAVLVASGLYAATHTIWLCVFGLYGAAVTAWCSARYAAAHRRWLAEQAWEQAHVLVRRPLPLNPCCHLAHHSGGAAHDRRRCTDAFHRLTSDLAAEHPRSLT